MVQRPGQHLTWWVRFDPEWDKSTWAVVAPKETKHKRGWELQDVTRPQRHLRGCYSLNSLQGTGGTRGPGYPNV
jgi:hypothetical protein